MGLLWKFNWLMLAKCLDQYLALKTLNNHVADIKTIIIIKLLYPTDASYIWQVEWYYVFLWCWAPWNQAIALII